MKNYNDYHSDFRSNNVNWLNINRGVSNPVKEKATNWGSIIVVTLVVGYIIALSIFSLLA